MSEEAKTIIVAALAALPPTLLGVAAIIKITNVHKELNSRLTEWKNETNKSATAMMVAAKAEGRLAGKAEEKADAKKRRK